jgi:hypothetical protein
VIRRFRGKDRVTVLENFRDVKKLGANLMDEIDAFRFHELRPAE